jgi:hypothetical protein
MEECLDKITGEVGGRPIRSHLYSYMDDIFAVSFTKGREGLQEHLKILEALLGALRAYNMILKLSKFEFLMRKTIFLGLPIDPEFVCLDLAKVQVIKQMARPYTKSGMRRLLGLLNYQRIFIPKFSLRSAPLYELLKKEYPDKYPDLLWTQN